MPYTTPRFKMQLTHPSSPSDDDAGTRRAVLRVEEIASGQSVFELELSSADLHDLLTQRWVVTETRRWGPHPERWGHEMRVTSAAYADLESAEDAKRELEARGWTVREITRNNRHRYMVVARRWDDANE